MSILSICKIALVFALSGSVAGCGTYVPDIQEAWDKPGTNPTPIPLESDIKQAVYCDIRKAVLAVFSQESGLSHLNNLTPPAGMPDFIDYGVLVTLTLTIDETSSISPGAVLNTPMAPATSYFANKVTVSTPQMFNLGLGGSLSSHATRIDKFSFFYTVRNIRDDISERCSKEEVFRDGSSFLLKSDLRLPEWLINALELERIRPGLPGAAPAGRQQSKRKLARKPAIALPTTTLEKASAPAGHGAAAPAASAANPQLTADTLTYEVKFDVISSGNITPTWKLVHVSANPTGTFFSLNRERTHDVTITFAPQACPSDGDHASTTYVKNHSCDGKPLPDGVGGVPIASALSAQEASQIGLAVANNLKGLIPQ